MRKQLLTICRNQAMNSDECFQANSEACRNCNRLIRAWTKTSRKRKYHHFDVVLAAPEDFKTTTSGTSSDENFVKMTIFPFHRDCSVTPEIICLHIMRDDRCIVCCIKYAYGVLVICCVGIISYVLIGFVRYAYAYFSGVVALRGGPGDN